MKKIQRFIALLSALTVVASLVAVPVHADGGLVPAGDGWITPGSGGAGAVTPAGAVAISTDMASMLLNEVEEVGQGIREDISAGARWLYSKINEDYCAEAENHRHSFKKQHTMVDGTVNNFYVCEHCGKSGGEVLSSVYGDTVEGMPLQGIDSSGAFLWYVQFSDLVWSNVYIRSDSYDFTDSGKDKTTHPVVFNNGVRLNCYNEGSSYAFSSSTNGYVYYSICIKYPCTGTYSYVENMPFISGIATDSQGVNHSFSCASFYSKDYIPGGYKTKGVEQNVSVSKANYSDCAGGVSRFLMDFYFPVLRVIPETSFDSSNYVPDTRPAAYVNQYLVQSGDTYTDSSTSIVNEDNSTIYNPVTGDTTTYDSWTYDYSTRTYTLTDNTNNSTSTVTYGDQNITINEGGNTYNVYYGTVINNNGGDTPTVPDGHKHNYTAAVTREPSCTTKGITTYTCADCNDSYQVYTAALGHDWVIKEQIPTAYSESGEVETSGYTIYECTRCHETYKSTDGTAPASGDGGELAIPDVSGELGTYWDRVKGFFAALPEMFGDLTEFLHDGWTYVPDEVMTLIEFGLSMVVFVGIINWIFKR